MTNGKKLYPSYVNPYLVQSERGMPDEMAVVGAGHIGPDIAYFLRTGLPDKKLYLVDVAEEPLKKAEERFKSYAAKAVKMKKMTQEAAEECSATSSIPPTTAPLKTAAWSSRRPRKIWR